MLGQALIDGRGELLAVLEGEKPIDAELFGRHLSDAIAERRGHHHDWGIARALEYPGAHHSGESPAIEMRHVNIRDEEIYRMSTQLLNGSTPIGRLDDVLQSDPL